MTENHRFSLENGVLYADLIARIQTRSLFGIQNADTRANARKNI